MTTPRQSVGCEGTSYRLEWMEPNEADIRDSDGRLIARASTDDAAMDVADEQSARIAAMLHRANTQPDLLAACEAMLACCERSRLHADFAGWSSGEPEAYALARTAVAKARGSRGMG